MSTRYTKSRERFWSITRADLDSERRLYIKISFIIFYVLHCIALHYIKLHYIRLTEDSLQTWDKRLKQNDKTLIIRKTHEIINQI